MKEIQKTIFTTERDWQRLKKKLKKDESSLKEFFNRKIREYLDQK